MREVAGLGFESTFSESKAHAPGYYIRLGWDRAKNPGHYRLLASWPPKSELQARGHPWTSQVEEQSPALGAPHSEASLGSGVKGWCLSQVPAVKEPGGS